MDHRRDDVTHGVMPGPRVGPLASAFAWGRLSQGRALALPRPGAGRPTTPLRAPTTLRRVDHAARYAYSAPMSMHSLVEAKTRLSDLIDRAQQGEAVVITRHGKPVAELRALRPRGRAMTHADLEWLDQHRAPRRNPVEDAGSLVSRMRDEEER